MSGYEGFGQVPSAESLTAPLTRLNLCEMNPNSEGCSSVSKELQKVLDATYAKSQVNKVLSGMAGHNPILASALAGARNPGGVLARAEELSQKLSGSGSEREAYKLFYSYGVAGFDVLSTYANMGPGVKSLVDAARQGSNRLPALVGWADRVATGNVDKTTIADGLSLASGAAVTVQNIAEAFGVGGQVLNKMVSSLDLASGCMSDMATQGMWGMASCGTRMLGSIFSKFKKQPVNPMAYVWSVFTPHNDDATSDIIASDAQRLAAVLKYYYRVSSYEQLYNLKRSVDFSSGSNSKWYDYPSRDGSSPFPGCSMTEIAQFALAMAGGVRPAYDDIKSGPFPVFDYLPPMKYWGSKYRALSGGASSPAIADVVGGGLAAAKVGVAGGAWARAAVTIVELINFFAAVTAIDRTSANPFVSYGLPVRTTRTGYSASEWTSYGDWYNTKDDLVDGVKADDARAHMTIGAFRLMAAFSYMHMQYKLGRRTISTDTGAKNVGDLIAAVEVRGPNVSVRMPVDPRSPVVGGQFNVVPLATMVGRMKGKAARLRTIEAMAKRKAEEDAARKGVPADFKMFIDSAITQGGQLIKAPTVAQLQALRVPDAPGAPAEIFKIVGLGLLALKLLK